jgi:hypothetical protein
MNHYDTSSLLKQRLYGEDAEFIVLPTNILQQIALFLSTPKEILGLCRTCKYLYVLLWNDPVMWKNYYKDRFRHVSTRWLHREDDLVKHFVKYRCKVEQKVKH